MQLEAIKTLPPALFTHHEVLAPPFHFLHLCLGGHLSLPGQLVVTT